jgi:hypothetical protein
MANDPQAPWAIRWVAAVLRALPGPTDAWADIVGHLAWPLLIFFLVLRFRWFLRSFLYTVLDRAKRDHMKLGPFEFSPHEDELIVLDQTDFNESTGSFEAADIARIERLFEFVDDPEGLKGLTDWLNAKFGADASIENFLTSPKYASERAIAFDEVEGLAQ